MKNFFRSMRVFVTAMPHFLMFEFLFKLVLSAVGAPLLAAMLKFTLSATNVNYLTDESLVVYLKSPITIAFIFILLFLLGFFAFVELSALAACFSCFYMKETITVGGMVRTGLKSFKKTFRGIGPLRFLLFMIYMPFAQFTLSAGMFIAPLMPILRRIFAGVSSTFAFVTYIVIQVICVLFIVGKCYTLHYMVLTKNGFSDSVKKSSKKITKKRSVTALQFLLWTLFILTVIGLATFGMAFLIVLGIKGFSRPEKALVTALNVLRYAMKIFSAVAAFFSAPAVMCWITGKFFADLDDDEKKEIKVPDRDRVKMKKVPKAILISSLVVTGIIVNAYYISGVYKGNIKLNGIVSGTQVTAHRGFSHIAPENTKYAFAEAIDSDADYIELDVQLTADGQLVVIHDKTLDRTTNGSGKVSDHTYAELLRLNADNGFGGEFSDAKIMLFSEVLEFIGHKCMLNVEIKNSGNVNEAVDKTVELIKKYKFEGSCYVTSFSYSALRRVKLLDPKIKTALITNVAASTGYSTMTDVDAVSMNFIFVNKSVVDTAHQNGKFVFVWTVDREEDIRNMMALGVDNIITNRPDRAVAIVNSDKLADVILNILETIFSS